MAAGDPFKPLDTASLQLELQYQARIAHALEYIASHVGAIQQQKKPETDESAALAKKLGEGNDAVKAAAAAEAASRSQPKKKRT